MRTALTVVAALACVAAGASGPPTGTPQVVIFSNGRVLTVRTLAEEGGQVRFETSRGEAFVVDRAHLRVDEMSEVNSALAVVSRECGQAGARLPEVSPEASRILARLGPELLGRCWPRGGTSDEEARAGPSAGAVPDTPPAKPGGAEPTATPVMASAATPAVPAATAAVARTPAAPSRATLRLSSPDGGDVVLSDAPDAWTGAHVVARVPAGTAAVVLEEVDLPVDEWALVRLRVRVVEGEHAGLEGWVFYQSRGSKKP